MARQATSAASSLFLFAGTEAWLPTGGLLTWRRGDHLDLLFLGLLLLAISFLLAFGHDNLPCFDGDAVVDAACYPSS